MKHYEQERKKQEGEAIKKVRTVCAFSWNVLKKKRSEMNDGIFLEKLQDDKLWTDLTFPRIFHLHRRKSSHTHKILNIEYLVNFFQEHSLTVLGIGTTSQGKRSFGSRETKDR